MNASRFITPPRLLVGAILLGLLALASIQTSLAHAEVDPNSYYCFGRIAAGTPEVGTTEQQVAYSFSCDGPITGYQLQSQLPLTGFEPAPLVSNEQGQPLTDSFTCNGEFPGYAVNCVGATKGPSETIAGQFAIGSKLCTEPREDPLLTVTYAYLEKGVVTQAISGPFDLGRPRGCPPSALSGTSRLTANPVQEARAKANKHAKSKKQTKSSKHAKSRAKHKHAHKH